MTIKDNPRTLGQRLNFRNWRISTKLMVVMVILALVPAALVTVIGTRTGQEALISEAKLNLIRLANSTAQRFDQLLLDNQNYIRMTATEKEIINYLITPKNEITPEMTDSVNYEIDALLNSNPLINLVSVFNAVGVVEAHTDPQYVNQNYFFRPYVQAALTGEDYTGGITIGVRDDQPGIIGASPISNYNDEVIGLISSRIKGDYITGILASTLQFDADLPPEDLAAIDIYLVNEYDIVVSHSDPQSTWLYHSLGTIEDDATLQKIVADKLLGGDCPADQPGCDADQKEGRVPVAYQGLELLGRELSSAMQQGETGTFVYCRPNEVTDPPIDHDSGNCPADQKHVIGYAPVANPSSERDDALFMVVVDVPEHVFLSDINAFVGRGITVTGIVTFISLIVALLIARMVSHPIGRLAEAAAAVEQDKPFEPEDIADVSSQGDEVGNLARVFSNMVVALRARMAELRTIYEIGQEISAGVELEETLQYILASIRGVITYDMAELCFYDDKKKQMIVRAAADFVSKDDGDEISYFEPETARFYNVNEGILSKLLTSRSAVLVANMQEDLDLELGHERKWGDSNAKSYLGVILKAKSKVVGSIELVSLAANKFSENNCRLLTSIATQAAIEVQNAQEIQEREVELARQIQQMDIVIDKDKQKQQVEDVLQSDFFTEVQKRAKEARRNTEE